MFGFIKRQSPVRLIAVGFLLVILLGSLLLKLPFSVREGVELSYIDSLYTSTSAVCVTGLVVVDAYDTFTPVGQTILAFLIQIGGLGVTAVSAGVILLIGRKMDLKSRNLVREAMSLDSGRGVVRFLRDVFVTTLTIELIGAILSFIVFVQEFPVPRAIGLSLFHAVAAFNNSGFDILGGGQNLIPYHDHVMLNLITCALIFFGGIGFLVIKEMWTERMRWKRFSMHSKVVLSVSLVLTVLGTGLLYLTEDITWLEAFFASVTTRTAGFSTCNYGTFSNAGILVMIVLMFIGASPGSTGGGIKTSALFALFQGLKSAATNKSEKAFHYALPKDAFRRAATIVLMALTVILTASFALMALEPHLPMRDILFEMTSAFGTVGLTTGITTQLSVASKVVSMLVMFIGRLGPLTIASVWYFSRGERVRYPEGNLTVG
ncbi:MAG: H(+)-transporting ATPase [Clostridia bacterium]|nr:H(+)-transporting ATPase [Clostridia bacterium]